MTLTLSQKLALGTAVVFGLLATIGVALFVGAYFALAPTLTGVSVDWSGFVVPFFSNTALAILSAIGFFGILFGRAERRNIYALVFVVGAIALHLLSWVAVAAGVRRFPDVSGLIVAVLGLVWFFGLAVALRPNYSLKRTAADGLR